MNDDELITAVRESFLGVRSDTAVEQILIRSRAARARRVPGVAVAVTATAAAVSVSLALNANRPAANHPATNPGNQPAAFTVARQADSTIQVSFFGELRDPAALERTLRAAGLPVSVTFVGQENPECQPYRATGNPVLPTPGQRLPSPDQAGGLLARVVGTPLTNPPQDAMVIHPSALPSGVGLRIAVMRGIPLGPSGPWSYPKGSGHPTMEVALVKASPQCTGS
jgi:hypothetical protein